MLASTTETDPRVNILMLQPVVVEEANEVCRPLGGMLGDTTFGGLALNRFRTANNSRKRE